MAAQKRRKKTANRVREKASASATKAKPRKAKGKVKKRKRLTQDTGDIWLFKYRPVNKYLLDSLIKSQLHFALPSNLNDPYDCQVDLKRALVRAADLAKGAQKTKLRRLVSDLTLLKTIKDLLRKTAVCSFSDSLLNPVLWSHYADEHRGVSLLYKVPQSLILDVTTEIVGYSGVEYSEDSLTNWLVANPVKYHVDYYVRIIKHALTIKGPMWAHEGEARIMRARAGQLDIDHSILTQICYGLRTPNSDKDLIRKIVESNYSEMEFCEIVVGDSDFGLKAKDL